MKLMHRALLAALGVSTIVAVGCKGKDEAAEKAVAEKRAIEASLAEVTTAVGKISAYLPYTADPGAKEKYARKSRGDMQRATELAANEIRHVANSARQRIDMGDSVATKALADAFSAISTACADANDQTKLDACTAKIKALDEALAKFEAAGTAAGISAKIPRVGPAAITDESKKAIASFVKARGPGQAEAAFLAKCADEKATVAAVIEACRAASMETEQVANGYEKSDESIRVLSATHNMSIGSQCNTLAAVETAQKEIIACKKKPTTPECKTLCAKVKTILDDGIPAAAFMSLEKEHADTCGKN